MYWSAACASCASSLQVALLCPTTPLRTKSLNLIGKKGEAQVLKTSWVQSGMWAWDLLKENYWCQFPLSPLQSLHKNFYGNKGEKLEDCKCNQFCLVHAMPSPRTWPFIPSCITAFINYKGLSLSIINQYHNYIWILKPANHNPSDAPWWIWSGLFNDQWDNFSIVC